MGDSVCLKPCLWVGDHLNWCKPPRFTTGNATQFTWVPESSEFIYAIKILGHTLMYLPKKDTVYFANPNYLLKNTCPSNTVFITQLVQDPECDPRLLVFDLLCDQGKSMDQVSPADRYARLQELQEHFSAGYYLQWCGQKEVLTEDFLESLPHCTRAILGICHKTGDFIEIPIS